MKSNFLIISLLLTLNAQAITGKAPKMCPSQCDGSKPIAPFNFKNAMPGIDPINGGPLGSTILVESDEGSTQKESVPSSEFLSDLDKFEEFSANQCGESLTSDAHSTIEVEHACSNNLLDRTEFNAKLKHKKGIKIPSLKIINTFFEAASSAAAQEKLKTKIYLSNDGQEIKSNKCLNESFDLGADDTLGITVKSQTCRLLFFPKIFSTITIGLPETSTTEVTNSYVIRGSIFSIPIKILNLYAQTKAPLKGASNSNASFVPMGLGSVGQGYNFSSDKIVHDKIYNLTDYTYSQEMSVPIGPLEITVELSAHGKLDVAAVTRATHMWANTAIAPQVNIDAAVEGSIGFWVARGGAEGKLNLVNAGQQNFAFAGVAALPYVYNGQNVESFAFSEQMIAYDYISGLGGEFNLFAKVRVPKFFKMKWKKYTKNLYRWHGTSMSGNLYELVRGPIFTNKLSNDFLNNN